MSDAPKKRTWLQFHLSTAVVLMFVAGGLLWLNQHGREVRLDIDRNTWPEKQWGWPAVALKTPACKVADSGTSHTVSGTWPGGVVTHSEERIGPDVVTDLEWGKPEIQPGGLTLDCLAAIAIIFLIAVLCEWLIRRKERRP
jgi:hypothetical protein